MNKTMTYRQGDVLLMRVKNIPQAATTKPSENGLVILAHGEATGHHHSLPGADVDWFTLGANQFVLVKSPTQLTHQEHAPIDLAPGRYQAIRQREYTPEAIRNVQD